MTNFTFFLNKSRTWYEFFFSFLFIFLFSIATYLNYNNVVSYYHLVLFFYFIALHLLIFPNISSLIIVRLFSTVVISYVLFFHLLPILLPESVDFSVLMGFPKSGNDTMFSIIALLSEMTILLIFIFFAVLITIAYIIDAYNAESNPFPRHFEKTIESTLDVLFVVFPTGIIIYLLVPSLGFIFNNEAAVETVFDLDIIGHQWYWSYEYSLFLGVSLYDLFVDESILFNKIEFDSLMDQETTYNRLLQVDKRVVIPVDTFIKATVTSQDVIHSWAVPQLGIKYDAIPGRLISFILHSNLLGIFYGQCSELCGVNHAFMPICIQSVEHDIFLDWVLCSLNINPSQIILNSLVMDPVLFETATNTFSIEDMIVNILLFR